MRANLNKNKNIKKVSSKENNKNNKNNKKNINNSNSKKTNKKDIKDKKVSNKLTNKVVNKDSRSKKLVSKKALKEAVANSLLNPTQSFYKDSVYSEDNAASRKRCAKLDKTKISTRFNRVNLDNKDQRNHSLDVNAKAKTINNNLSNKKDLNSNRSNNGFSGIKVFLSLILMVLFLGGAYLSMNKEHNFFHFNLSNSEQLDNELTHETVKGNLIIDNSVKEKVSEGVTVSSNNNNLKQDVNLNKKVIKKHKTTNKTLKNKNKKK